MVRMLLELHLHRPWALLWYILAFVESYHFPWFHERFWRLSPTSASRGSGFADFGPRGAVLALELGHSTSRGSVLFVICWAVLALEPIFGLSRVRY